MANVVQPIGVASFIEEHNRGLEKNRDISKWFLEEKLTIDFGDYVGRPSAKITLQKEYLTRFLENGWTIDHVEQTVESGTWGSSRTLTTKSGSSKSTKNETVTSGSDDTNGKTVESSDQKTTTDGNTTSNTNSSSASSENKNETEITSSSTSSSNSSTSTTCPSSVSRTTTNSSGESSSSSSYTESQSGRTDTSSTTGSTSSSSYTESQSGSTDTSSTTGSTASSGTRSTSSTGSSTSNENSTTSGNTKNSTDTGIKTTTDRSESGKSESTSGSSGSEQESTSGTTEESESGEAFWATVQRITLKRRRMQPELVLQDMIDSYVTERNEGVTNEDARYNELVTLYGIMLNRNETEGNAIVNSALDVTGLFNSLRESIQNTWSAAHNAAVDLKLVASDGAAVEIRYEYEALIAKTRSQMIGQGTYNGTVWPTVEAGIRRQMDAAIVEAKAKGLASASSAITNVLEAKGDVMAQLVNAKNAIASAIDNRKITVIELRNTVMQAMLNFMGSREDVYPQIQEISQLASQIGFTVGAAGNVL